MNCPMTQTTLAPNLVVYASMTNQSPENNLTPRNKVTLTRTGILDCRGKPLLQKLEQNTLNDIKIVNLRKFFYSSALFSPVQCPDFRNFASQFRCSISTCKGCNLNLEGLQGLREKTNPFAWPTAPS